MSAGKKKTIIGLTGAFGSGKTTVAGIFKSYGAKVIDADIIAHRVIKPKGRIYKNIIKVFGKNILKNNKTIDRDRLAKIVFNDEVALQKLNKIVHPEVIRIIKEKIAMSPQRVIVIDAPLLIEAGLTELVDKLIVVKVSREKQMRRIINKTALDRKDTLKRIKAQLPLAKKIALADFVIDNSGSIENTKEQVGKIWTQALLLA